MPIIVLDLDGTLLTHEYKMSPLTKEALLKVQSEGATLVIASGRYVREIMNIAYELEMEKHHGIVIGANGAIALDVMTQEVFHDHPLLPNESRKILKHIENFEVVPMFSNDKFAYSDDFKRQDEIFAQVIQTGVKFGDEETRPERVEVVDLANFIDFPIYKILTIGDPAYMQQNQEAFLKPIEDICEGALTTPFAFEFTALGMDKGATLEKVINLKEWDRKEIYAFGDGHNDITLLQVAGTGIAMGNAAEDVKEIADFVTKSHREDGIVYALKHFGLL